MTATNTDRAATIQDRPPNFRDESGHLYLVRCFRCEPKRGRENYALAVAVGVCVECGWPDDGCKSVPLTADERAALTAPDMASL